MIEIIFLLLGFGALVLGADKLVEGASAIGQKMGISQLIIGLTIVAFGTSAPELVINMVAGLTDNGGIAIGNVFGSSTSNILLILGVAALIYPLRIQDNTVSKEIPFSILAVSIAGILVNERFFDVVSSGSLFLSRSDGLVLLGLFLVFLYYMLLSARSGEKNVEEEAQTLDLPWWQAILYVVGGLAGLVLGGQWVVDGSVFIASALGASQAVIGVTVVALGSSLPELVTSAAAALKKNADIAIGNIVGSNIFNITWVLGISAVIAPVKYDTASNFDFFVMLGASLALFAVIFTGKKQIFQRWQGALCVAAYVTYIIASVVREIGI